MSPLECQFVDLESTTAMKFSRHLIVHLPGMAFADSHECGAFVHTLCIQLANCAADFVHAYCLKHAAPGTCPESSLRLKAVVAELEDVARGHAGELTVQIAAGAVHGSRRFCCAV